MDVRDLYMHGDQFLYVPNPQLDIEGDDHQVYWNASNHSMFSYPDVSSIDKIFKDRVGTKKYVREDGIVKLMIKGYQRDYT